MPGTTITISGDSNDSKVILSSENSTIIETDASLSHIELSMNLLETSVETLETSMNLLETSVDDLETNVAIIDDALIANYLGNKMFGPSSMDFAFKFSNTGKKLLWYRPLTGATKPSSKFGAASFFNNPLNAWKEAEYDFDSIVYNTAENILVLTVNEISFNPVTPTGETSPGFTRVSYKMAYDLNNDQLIGYLADFKFKYTTAEWNQLENQQGIYADLAGYIPRYITQAQFDAYVTLGNTVESNGLKHYQNNLMSDIYYYVSVNYPEVSNSEGIGGFYSRFSMNEVEQHLATRTTTLENIGLLDGHFSLVINSLDTVLFCDYFKLEDGVLKLRRYRPNANTTPSRIDMVWWLNTYNAKLEHDIPLIYVGKTSDGYEFTSEWNDNIHPTEKSNTLALKMKKIVLNPETLKNLAYDKEWLIKKTTAGWNAEKPLYLLNDANTTLWTGNDGVDVSFTVYAEQSVTIDGVTGPRYTVQGIPLFTRFALIKNGLDKFSHNLINNLNKDVNKKVDDLIDLESRVLNLENNEITLGDNINNKYFIEKEGSTSALHIMYDENNSTHYCEFLIIANTIDPSLSDLSWVQVFKIPLIHDESRPRTLTTRYPTCFKDPGITIDYNLPYFKMLHLSNLSFDTDYSAIFSEQEWLFDDYKYPSQADNLSVMIHGIDASDVYMMHFPIKFRGEYLLDNNNTIRDDLLVPFSEIDPSENQRIPDKYKIQYNSIE